MCNHSNQQTLGTCSTATTHNAVTSLQLPLLLQLQQQVCETAFRTLANNGGTAALCSHLVLADDILLDVGRHHLVPLQGHAARMASKAKTHACQPGSAHKSWAAALWHLALRNPQGPIFPLHHNCINTATQAPPYAGMQAGSSRQLVHTAILHGHHFCNLRSMLVLQTQAIKSTLAAAGSSTHL